jgi:hypothetical protein
MTDSMKDVGFEVLTAVAMKSSVFWDITLCSPLSQPIIRKNMSPPSSGLKSKPSFACHLLHAGFLLGVFFNPEDGGNMFLSNVG